MQLLKQISDTRTKQRVAIIIPTYNEEGNIERLIDQFFLEIFPGLPEYDMHITVVDGRSSDNTADIVQRKIYTTPNLHLIQEDGKNGIGSAYLKGFNFAIKELDADVVIQFDGDSQHPPQIVPILLDKIAEGYDYVLGSRSIEGGSEPAGRHPLRLFFTHTGGFVARLILFFPGRNFKKVTDPTTGLRATRVKGTLDKLNLSIDHLYSKKFGCNIQFLSETLATDAKYAEIPLQFNNRFSGKSKFEKKTAFDTLFVCLKTRFYTKYCKRKQSLNYPQSK